MPPSSSAESIPIDDEYVSRRREDQWTLSSGRTMATTTTMYRYENGRTYHAYRDGEYWQPNDLKHNNHEALAHHLCIMMMNDRLYLAPISSNPKRILDVGTGTGIWATDIADKFSSATVIGTDLSPIAVGMHPGNCEFIIEDAASDWLWPANHFDFIHIRGMFGSLGDWPRLYEQALAAITPGGYIEQVEWSIHIRSIDNTLRPDMPLANWTKRFQEIQRLTGKEFELAESMGQHMRKVGFEDIFERTFRLPIGPWSRDPHMKELGRWNLLSWEEGMEGWVMAPYTRVLGWTYAETQDYLKQLRASLRDRTSHCYHEVRLVYGRKPRSTSSN